MLDYIGQECLGCHGQLKDDDDVVHCPICGCPQHRDCWNEKKQCVMHESHGTASQWKPLEKKSEKAKASDPSADKCQRCGYDNPPDVRVCLNCGLDVSVGEPTPGFHSRRPEPDKNTMYEDIPFHMVIDPLGGVPAGTLIDGVPAGDIGLYVQSQSAYYVQSFAKMQSNGTKTTFNPSAFMLTGAWFIFRKMYFIGIIFYAYFLALISSFFIIYGKIIAPLVEGKTSVTFAEMRDIIENSLTQRQSTIMEIWAIACLGMLGIMLFCGLRANQIYKTRAINDIRAINRESKNADEFKSNLKEKGGANVPAAFTVLICYVIISWFLQMYFLR